jgi:hypothetical protein
MLEGKQNLLCSRNQRVPFSEWFMKLHAVCLLAAIAVVPAAFSQAAPPQQPGNYIVMDKHCKEVHPGDTISYSLTVEGLQPGQPVLADLQMRPHHESPLLGHGLPAPDFHNLGGGGLGEANGASQNMYNFSFTVPKEIYSGRYHGVEVLVKANAPVADQDARRYVDVSHHASKRVHSFCLTVVSPYGEREAEPQVTNFQSGPIVPKQ